MERQENGSEVNAEQEDWTYQSRRNEWHYQSVSL